jgi:short subunit dehydrogenase-like uncharacterized protein
VLQYLLEASRNQKLLITLGGWNQSKLETLKSEFASHASTAIQDVVVLSRLDFPSLKKMENQSCIVLNCAGPYLLYSSHVVSACAEVGTYFVYFGSLIPNGK